MRFDKNFLFVTFQDKYKVKEYARSKCVKTANLLYVTDKPETIPFGKLPQKYLIKANHGCSWNILCFNSKLYLFGNGKKLINQDELPEIKLTTNRLEQSFSQNGRRRVNIDPGYLLYERFVLASGKNFSHRIYIGGGIYADLTLIYQRGGFEKLPWTYPDYADQPMLAFLAQVRNKYAVDLKAN